MSAWAVENQYTSIRPVYCSLDTNTVSHLIKLDPQVTQRLLAVPMHSVCIPAGSSLCAGVLGVVRRHKGAGADTRRDVEKQTKQSESQQNGGVFYGTLCAKHWYGLSELTEIRP